MIETETRPLELPQVPLTGVHLIEASAGTGKTFTITGLFLRFLTERRVRLSEIAAVTFTNAATEELRERVARRILAARDALGRVLAGEAETSGDDLLEAIVERTSTKEAHRLLERAARELDQSAVFTIHGFSQRILREHALDGATRLEAELSADTARLVNEAFRDFWDGRVAQLDAETFRALGGASLFSELASVAKGAMAHVDLPVVDLPEVTLERRLGELSSVFREVRRALPLVDDARRHLAGASQTSYKPAAVAAAAEFWKLYLASERPGLEIGEQPAKWRASVVATKGKKAGFRPEHPFFEALEPLFEKLEEIEGAANALRHSLRRELIEFVRERVASEKSQTNVQSFDDLLLELRAALRDPARGPRLASGVARRFPVVLIDEFQDTDPIQAEIFERIFAGRSRGALFFIGDPKQSIYSFRGADVDAYLATHRLTTGPVLSLGTSWRSGPRLVAAQNLLFGSCSEPFLEPGVRYRPVAAAPGREDRLLDREGCPVAGIAVSLLDKSEVGNTPEWIARSIVEHLRSGLTIDARPLSPSDIAVLTRTNHAAVAVQRELLRRGVPAVVHGDRSVFEAEEAKEFRRILLALAEPRSPRLLRAALATRFLGVTARDLVRFAEDARELEEWSARFVEAGALFRERGVAFALSELERRSGLLVRTLGEPDGERRMTNYRHLLELLHEAEVTEHLGPTSLVRYLEAAIADPMGHGMAPEARQVRLESDADAVTLTTIHRSKGLEYGLVFLPDLHEVGRTRKNLVFRFRDEEGAHLDVRGRESEFWERAERAEQSEGLRLLYVGLTRAKHRTVFLYPSRSTDTEKQKPPAFDALAYLLHSDRPGEGTSLGEYLAAITSVEERRRFVELAEDSGGAFEIAPLDERDEGWTPAPEATPRLEARAIPRIVPSNSRVASFSSLTRSAGGLSRIAREGKDIDEGTSEAVVESDERDSETVALLEYPRGAGPGEALHSIFEHSFGKSEEARTALVAETLVRHGLGAVDAAMVERGLRQAFATPLSAEGWSLGDLGRDAVFPEMEFSFPVARQGNFLSSERLAAALGGRANSTLPSSYLESVARLPFAALGGFLRGFIDLVCERNGRFYVLDYKSNFLGATYADYRREQLERSMAEHHYFLQASIYSVAIHRYLEQRLVDYDYDRHFGGVLYLFVRGMRSDVVGSGVFPLRFERAEMERLSRSFDDPSLVGAARPNVGMEARG